MISYDSICSDVKGRLIRVLPGVDEIVLNKSPANQLDLQFALGGRDHRFWLDRRDGNWILAEHRINGAPQIKAFDGRFPRFEQLIAAELGAMLNRRPRIEVKELRCPEDPRRLFCKLIIHTVPLGDRPSSLLEIACPQCKRSTKQITMHYFSSATGELMKTEYIEPWLKREPKEWFVSQGPPAKVA